MSTSTYLTGVNNTITESGTDLATFLTNGSDFTSNTNAMIQRIRGWYARAWKDIQQQAYDWDFMEEQGLCNIDPGVMFYTDGTPITTFSNIFTNGTFNIYDQNGSVAVSNVVAGSFTDLTGVATSASPMGYFDLSTSGGVPLTFSLKPAAEYFIIPSGTLQYTLSYTVGGFGTSSLPPPTAGTTLGVAKVAYDTITGLLSLIKNYGPVATFVAAPNGNVLITLNSALKTDWLAAQVLVNTMFVTYVAGTSISAVIQSVNLGTGQTSWYNTMGNTTLGAVYGSVSSGSDASGKAFIHSWKSFNFNEELQSGDFQELIQQIDDDSFRAIDFYKSPATGEVVLPFVPWEVFRGQYDLSSAAPGFPRLITKDDTGRYRLYPHPYYTVSIKFDYDRTPQILSAYTDTLKGLQEDFFDIVMWKALIYYGEFDEQPSVVSRATKNYKTLLSRLELKNRAKFHFLPKRLY